MKTKISLITMVILGGLITVSYAQNAPRQRQGNNYNNNVQRQDRQAFASQANSDLPQSAPPMMRALDSNHDGIVDATEIQNASSALKELDRNNDGILNGREIMGARQQAGINRPTRQNRGAGGFMMSGRQEMPVPGNQITHRQGRQNASWSTSRNSRNIHQGPGDESMRPGRQGQGGTTYYHPGAGRQNGPAMRSQGMQIRERFGRQENQGRFRGNFPPAHTSPDASEND